MHGNFLCVYFPSVLIQKLADGFLLVLFFFFSSMILLEIQKDFAQGRVNNYNYVFAGVK